MSDSLGAVHFLRRLIGETNRRMFVILDNLIAHKGVKVRAWVEAHCDAIELFHLPQYTLELNNARPACADL